MDNSNRDKRCFEEGNFSERRFSSYLEGRKVPFERHYRDAADTKKKIDFRVGNSTVQVKAPSNKERSGLDPSDLTIEHRDVRGKIGWLWTVDYVVKFIDADTFLKIDAATLRDAVKKHLPEPPERCRRAKAQVGIGWYARYDYKGKDRSGECCIVVPKEWYIEHCSTKERRIR